jgi:hypothetical protein
LPLPGGLGPAPAGPLPLFGAGPLPLAGSPAPGAAPGQLAEPNPYAAPVTGAAVDSFNLGGHRAERQHRIPRGLLSLLGYVTSAFVGLGAGYLLLHWLQPNRFPWPAHFLFFW